TEIPPDRRYITPNGLDFDGSTDLIRERIAGLIEAAAKTNAAAGSNTRKIADVYYSYMDGVAIEAKGLAPLRPHLDNFHTANLFGLWVAPGFNDPERWAAYLLQGGLEMPDREYYLSDSESMRDIRAKYQRHVSALLKLAGFTDPDVRAQHIVELEHAIAEKHIPLADQNDIHKANNTWEQADFAASAPGLDWAAYFRGAGLSSQASFIV